MFTYTTISNILLYCLKDTVGTVIDLSFELVKVLPGKFPETRDHCLNKINLKEIFEGGISI